MVTKMDSIQNADTNTDKVTASNAAALQRERLSALADGQLHGEALIEAMALFDDAQASGQARATWHTLHVVGDVLRGQEAVSYRKDVDFLARFSSALQQEPNLAASVPLAAAGAAPVVANIMSIGAIPLASRPPTATQESANEPVFFWKWAAGLSSVAAAVAISWNLVGGTVVSSGAQLAQAPSPAVVVAAPASQNPSSLAPQVLAQVDAPAARVATWAQRAQAPLAVVPLQSLATASDNEVMLRNPQLDAMIAAHSQLGGSSALQMPSGFLRNATFDVTSNPAANGSAR
jgi:sigma-E factor negative regulatory protein RseA